ncbi:hypothetical protein EIN_165120 [Entamoeba invadens IP1]|uniref:Uncharacterized protein n=2 Tax=Entamoeba invadens TaxID=33085 RepID=A0A0A1U4B5_ENTIV|nr:hypothetical protein EIN_165120 [Entamoeba invadens IP1]ELP89062.1 hypothetical protein EIN_165120 [Entamoeba invadens IP1]BAN42249.1 hypothetical protein [Entamoeba invadens]|eukprot:XP_004255833.1 hypothetical protein EIN_165120 [Entamoeba invadens IP1]
MSSELAMIRKKHSIDRNTSVNRERLSNASIIGLYVLKGNSVEVKLPSKKSTNTLPHLIISRAEIDGVDVNERVKKRYGFDYPTTKNERRNWEVATYNEIADSVAGNYYKLTKRSNTVKTLKLKIFKEIGPLNKEGVDVFGRRVTDYIISQNKSRMWSQNNFVKLEGYDQTISSIFKEVCTNCLNVTYNSISPSVVFSSVEESEKSRVSTSFGENESYSETQRVKCAFVYSQQGSYVVENANWF